MSPEQLERSYRAFTRCREITREATTEAEIFGDLCEVAVVELGYRLAWVGLVSDAGAAVRPVAQAGYEDGYLEAVQISAGTDPLGQGPTGRAIREGRPAVCQNIGTDARYRPWRDDAAKRGYASSAAIPLCDGQRCFGALNLYAAEPDAFDDDELALLEECAIDLRFGLQRLQMASAFASLGVRMERAMRAETAALAALTIAHDINNMIQVVMSGIELALVTEDEALRRTSLEEAGVATHSAGALSRQLLSLARRAAGDGASVDVDHAIRGMETLLGRLAPSAAVEVHLDAPGARTRTTSLDVERILINLVVNAGHAMPGGGRLRIATARRTLEAPLAAIAGPLGPGAFVLLTVADEGDGIAPEVLPRVFDPFFTTKASDGTGLGLPAVLDLVTRTGGGLVVDSAPGEGTLFSVYLPLAS